MKVPTATAGWNRQRIVAGDLGHVQDVLVVYAWPAVVPPLCHLGLSECQVD